MEGMKLASLKIKNTSFKCNFSPVPPGGNSLVNAIIPLVETDIINAVTPPITNALNSLLKSQLPFPGVCQ